MTSRGWVAKPAVDILTAISWLHIKPTKSNQPNKVLNNFACPVYYIFKPLIVWLCILFENYLAAPKKKLLWQKWLSQSEPGPKMWQKCDKNYWIICNLGQKCDKNHCDKSDWISWNLGHGKYGVKPNEPADIVCDQGSKPTMRTLIELWFLIKTKKLVIEDMNLNHNFKTYCEDWSLVKQPFFVH